MSHTRFSKAVLDALKSFVALWLVWPCLGLIFFHLTAPYGSYPLFPAFIWPFVSIPSFIAALPVPVGVFVYSFYNPTHKVYAFWIGAIGGTIFLMVALFGLSLAFA